MGISYCYQWNDIIKAPRDPYDDATARVRHERGELYTAVLDDHSVPHTLVEVRLEVGAIGIYFLDGELRRWTTYSFGSPESERLFLDEYRRVEFDDSGAQISTEIVYFAKDGLLTVQQFDARTNMLDKYNIQADISGNWEPIPHFGDYSSIARFDRPSLGFVQR